MERTQKKDCYCSNINGGLKTMRQALRLYNQEEKNFMMGGQKQQRKSIPIRKDYYAELREVEMMMAKIRYGWGKRDE